MSNINKSMENSISVNDLISFVLNNCCKSMDAISDDNTRNDTKMINTSIVKEVKLLSQYFQNNVKYVKIIQVISGIPSSNANISLCSSILYCIIENFSALCKDDMGFYIDKFFEKLSNEVRKRKKNIKVLDKKNVLENINQHQMSDNVLLYIVTYLNINVFKIMNDKIIVYQLGKQYNIFKQNILVYFDGMNYHPLIHSNCNDLIWEYNGLLKQFIENNKDYIHVYNPEQQQIKFSIGYDNDVEILWSNEYDIHETKLEKGPDLTDDNKLPNKSSDDDKSKKIQSINESTEQVLDAVFYKQDKQKKIKYDVPTLTKCKCIELRQIAAEIGIKLFCKIDGKYKQKNKQELINEIIMHQ